MSVYHYAYGLILLFFIPVSGMGQSYEFARPIPVDLSPQNAGEWTKTPDQTLQWTLKVQSPGAYSLNLGFDRFFLPPSAKLYLYSKDRNTRIGPLSSQDNESHLEWWSPLIPGDELTIELRIAAKELPQLQFHLNRINHDFANFYGGQITDCMIDTRCSEEDGWAIVDQYRDQIRSVVLITIEGTRACTAFLVNNTAQDCRPFLITAYHCRINTRSAPSIVAYWNFQNSTCRPPNTPVNIGPGDGVFGPVNSGAAFRASWQLSDVVLIELDDEPADDNAYFAGWNRSAQVPRDTVASIHHPNSLEKRISFSFRSTYAGNWETYDLPRPTGNHLIVPYWSVGSTAPASSGAPLFDKNGLVTGQLHGGAASCDTKDFDSYGWLYNSWYGGNDSATALRYWLDPLSLGLLTLSGKNFDNCTFSLQVFPGRIGLCPGDTAIFNLYPQNFNLPPTFTLEQETLPPGMQYWFEETIPGNTGSQRLFITLDSAIPAADYPLTLTATSGGQTTSAKLIIEANHVPDVPTLIRPSAGSIFIGNTPRFYWESEDAGNVTRELQLSSNALFQDNTRTYSVADNNPETFRLRAYGQYYWRVKSSNDCGTSLSEISNFQYLPDLDLRFAGKKVVLSPNPTSAYLYLSLSQPLEQPVQLRLFSVNGALVKQQTLPASKVFFPIDLSHLPNGIYLLQLEEGNFSFVQKVIKQD